MDDQLIRIGRGPQGPRVKRPAHYWIVAAAVLISVSLLIVVVYIWGPAQQQAAAPAATSPGLGTIDAKGACAVLVPTLLTSTTAVTELAAEPDGSTVDWVKVEASVRDLEAIMPIAPLSMQPDVQAQIVPLREMLDRYEGRLGATGTINLEEFRASGLRISATCAQSVD